MNKRLLFTVILEILRIRDLGDSVKKEGIVKTLSELCDHIDFLELVNLVVINQYRNISDTFLDEEIRLYKRDFRKILQLLYFLPYLKKNERVEILEGYLLNYDCEPFRELTIA